MPVRSDRYAALKYGGYALLLLGLFLLQSARGTALRLWGGALDALPFFVAAAALLEGPFAGGSLGFAAGLLLSVNSTMAEGLWPAYLGLFGVLFGLFGAYYLRPVILSALGGGLLCMSLQAAVKYVFYYRLVFRAGLGLALREFAGTLLLSLPVGALVWLAVRGIHRRFTEDTL